MKHVEDQSVFKIGVKRWLKERNLDYKWMADQCGISEITFRNWMSQKAIPPLKQQLIERVMDQMSTVQPTSSPSSIPGIQVDASLSLTVKLSPELYSQLEAKASQQGISLGDMVAQAISSLINGQSDFLIP
ncbi:hypothetical protein [Akkermansia sp.]|uniref:hypothetical protein n=1 Tax=Akkermansia sp. TaxID=1872421 RepID=UPI0025C20EA3|nr:hypothetical protein [Akkermansia sp.]MCC8149586.1 type II toxin-antitoxin system HicB family antitoxin [Akkermansia sp.]